MLCACLNSQAIQQQHRKPSSPKPSSLSFFPLSFLFSFPFFSTTHKPNKTLISNQTTILSFSLSLSTTTTTKWFIITVKDLQTPSKTKNHSFISWTVQPLFTTREQSLSCCLFSSSSPFSLVAMSSHLFSLDLLSLYLFYVSISNPKLVSDFLVFLILLCVDDVFFLLFFRL